MPQEQQITEEQAQEALQQLTERDLSESEAPVGNVQRAADEQPVDAGTEVADGETAQAVEEVAEEGHEDDIESLRARFSELETQMTEKEKRYEDRLKAFQDRTSANEQILRNRFLQKSTALDKAMRLLETAKTDAGVSEEEVNRAIQEIRGTMNPESASYVPPVQQQATASDDQMLVMNAFLNERGMTSEEADQFGRWINTKANTSMTPMELNVAGESLAGFLQLAHSRWQNDLQRDRETEQADAVQAVKAVQNTQRQAARAASAKPTAPRRRQETGPAEVDLNKLTKDDISSLLRQSVEQYQQ